MKTRVIIGSLLLWLFLVLASAGCAYYHDRVRNPFTGEAEKTPASRPGGTLQYQPVGTWTYVGLDGKKHTETVYREVK